MKRISILIVLMSLICVSNMYGFYVSNQTCQAFPNQCTDGKLALVSTPNLDQLIIEAGGYFLQSHGDYKLLLKKLELAEINGIDYAELLAILDSAIAAMDSANTIYLRVWEMSQSLEYDPVVLEKLKTFDYSGYKFKNRLIPSVFAVVEGLLKAGDVKGLFFKSFKDSGKLLSALKETRKAVDSCITPGVPGMWRINQAFIEFDLVGQYSSEVFMNLE